MLKDIHWIGRTVLLLAVIMALAAVAVTALSTVAPARQSRGQVERRCSIPPGYLDPLGATLASDNPNARFTLYCDK